MKKSTLGVCFRKGSTFINERACRQAPKDFHKHSLFLSAKDLFGFPLTFEYAQVYLPAGVLEVEHRLPLVYKQLPVKNFTSVENLSPPFGKDAAGKTYVPPIPKRVVNAYDLELFLQLAPDQKPSLNFYEYGVVDKKEYDVVFENVQFRFYDIQDV